MDNKPKISIITVSFNAEDFIERTLKSVTEQTYPSIEYLVIDGASKDGTMEIVKRYKDKIDYSLSEPDKSHFDAMNKGIQKSTGDYILIMNAGDIMKYNDSLEKMMEGHNNADFIYGRAEFINENGETRPWHKTTPPPEKLNHKSFLNGMVICHHCMIVRRSMAPLFSLGPWKVSNDIEWSIRVMKNVKTKHFYDGIFCQYLEGGISKKQRIKAIRERFDISVFHFGYIPSIIQQVKILFRAIGRGRIS